MLLYCVVGSFSVLGAGSKVVLGSGGAAQAFSELQANRIGSEPRDQESRCPVEAESRVKLVWWREQLGCRLIQ